MTTKWYSCSFVVDNIPPQAGNPLNLQEGNIILNGFFKLENIYTDNTGTSEPITEFYNSSTNTIMVINTGTFGKITEFYDLTQIYEGKYVNILQNNNILNANRMIYFKDEQLIFTFGGTNISIKNNTALNQNYLNFIINNKIGYYNNHSNINLCLNIYQWITVQDTLYTTIYSSIKFDTIYNSEDPSSFFTWNYFSTPYNDIDLKMIANEISGPLSPPIIFTPLTSTFSSTILKKKKIKEPSAHARLLKLKNQNICNVKNTHKNSFYVKNTVDKNSMNNTLVRTQSTRLYCSS